MFLRALGVDLGTSNTLIYAKGKGIVLRAPSVLVFDNKNGKVLAMGEEARAMMGKTHAGITAIRPVRGGVIADYKFATKLMMGLCRKAALSPFFRPVIVVCFPSCITDVEKRAIEEAAVEAGAREVLMLEEPLAAGLGAGLPVSKPTGSMVLDIGGGTADAAVLALNGIVVSRSVRTAGDVFDGAIASHVRKKHSLYIGEPTAEEVKLAIASVDGSGFTGEIAVCGRDLITGLPRQQRITAEEIRECLAEPVGEIVEIVRSVLEATPPELVGDILQNGLTLTGGGALLRGLDRLISQHTGLSVRVAENPLDCVANGVGIALSDPAILREITSAGRRR